jgi:hypothetical protein
MRGPIIDETQEWEQAPCYQCGVRVRVGWTKTGNPVCSHDLPVCSAWKPLTCLNDLALFFERCQKASVN